MIVVDGERVQIKGKGETIKKEMAALIYGMRIQCPKLFGECVDYLDELDEKNPSFTIWDYKRSK